ncbi:MAG: hemerythrin domain-containing protein [Deltaproteobacteria bacterium]|nr:hemerythrin domain-containing protein [Deltaproteobacteria bacterium]
MNGTIQILGSQHQEVLARLAEVEANLSQETSAAAADLATFLEDDVLDHFVLEEEALFPQLALHIGNDSGPLVVMNAEHAEFRSSLQALAMAVKNGDVTAQRQHAEGLIDLLRGHIFKEDHVLFPLALRLLTPEEIQQVDARAAERHA